jgi:hypothetical protein
LIKEKFGTSDKPSDKPADSGANDNPIP